MTGLATFTRTELRTRLLENADLRPMLDLEPYLRDILRAFYESKFQEGLRLIKHHRVSFPLPFLRCADADSAKRKARQHLDLHLAAHVNALLPAIESRALLSYFAPFTSVSLNRMAKAFGWNEAATKQFVIRLIERGEMKARVDNEKGMLVATNIDGRKEAFKKTIEEGTEIQRRAEALAYRFVNIPSSLLPFSPPVRRTKTDMIRR